MSENEADTVVLDIEVVGPVFEDLDPHTQEYLLGRKKSTPEEQADIKSKTALTLGLGEVICVGLWSVGKQRGIVFAAGPEGESLETDDYKVLKGSEAQILDWTWTKLSSLRRSGSTVVTYNGRNFDVPVLAIRSAMHDIDVPVNMLPNRMKNGNSSFHVDLKEVLCFNGVTRDGYTLDYWCQRFGIPSSKGDISGPQVGDAFRRGEIDRIADYCLGDCKATAALYERLKDTLIPSLHF